MTAYSPSEANISMRNYPDVKVPIKQKYPVLVAPHLTLLALGSLLLGLGVVVLVQVRHYINHWEFGICSPPHRSRPPRRCIPQDHR